MVELHTQEHAEMVVVENGEIIVGRVCPCPFRIVRSAQRDARRGVVHDVRVECIVHAVDEALVVVETEV